VAVVVVARISKLAQQELVAQVAVRELNHLPPMFEVALLLLEAETLVVHPTVLVRVVVADTVV
jgi:hypothetical protein